MTYTISMYLCCTKVFTVGTFSQSPISETKTINCVYIDVHIEDGVPSTNSHNGDLQNRT
jgi:hypothetical protein